MSDPTASLEPVSVERDGIILSGVGVTEDSLTETMEARESGPDKAESGETADGASQPQEVSDPQPSQTRDEGGRFSKPTRAQNRIEKLAQEKNTEKTAREAAEQRAADLEKRLAALEQARSQPPAPAGSSPAAHQSEPAPTPQRATAPKLADFVAEIGTKYAAYEDAVEAYTDAKIAAQDFDARIRTSIEADRASRDLNTHLESLFVAGRKVYPDFDAVLRSAADLQYPRDTLHRIWSLPNAPDVMYALSQNRDLGQKIAGIRDPFVLAQELMQVVTPKPVASPASTAPAVSNAPAPYQPVGSGSKTTAPSLDEIAASGGDEYDRSGYRERRNQERRAGRR